MTNWENLCMKCLCAFKLLKIYEYQMIKLQGNSGTSISFINLISSNKRLPHFPCTVHYVRSVLYILWKSKKKSLSLHIHKFKLHYSYLVSEKQLVWRNSRKKNSVRKILHISTLCYTTILWRERIERRPHIKKRGSACHRRSIERPLLLRLRHWSQILKHKSLIFLFNAFFCLYIHSFFLLSNF